MSIVEKQTRLGHDLWPWEQVACRADVYPAKVLSLQNRIGLRKLPIWYGPWFVQTWSGTLVGRHRPNCIMKVQVFKQFWKSYIIVCLNAFAPVIFAFLRVSQCRILLKGIWLLLIEDAVRLEWASGGCLKIFPYLSWNASYCLNAFESLISSAFMRVWSEKNTFPLPSVFSKEIECHIRWRCQRSPRDLHVESGQTPVQKDIILFGQHFNHNLWLKITALTAYGTRDWNTHLLRKKILCH